jgi:gliding motility-associated lipoprotein GldB
MRTIVISLCLAMVFVSCRKEKCSIDPDVAKIPVNVEFIRLEQNLSMLKSKEEAIQFINDFPEFSESFLERSHYPHDSILADQLYKLSNDIHIDTLFQEAKEVFGDMEDLKGELRLAFQHIKKHYPEFREPTIYTAITGLGNDLFVSDSIIVIGLDYFLGENATFRPAHLPEYILKRYRKEYIVPNIILLMSKKYNATDYQNNTMLADMIFYGKAYYFTKAVMPCTADSLLIGYTGEEIRDVRDNENIIWANFIENQLLFETSHFTKNKFLGERPKVFEIGSKCPGRVGVWVGWEIINRYMSRNKVTLVELMADNNVNDIFAKSKYRPRK